MRTIFLSIFTAVIAISSVVGQGALVPGGAPASTMKRLDEVEARAIVNAANTPGDAQSTFIINAPGSYYLTGSLTGVAGKHGISIQSNDVTLDLNGFALISGGGGATRGVNIPSTVNNFCVRNGTVSGWTGGGVRTDLAVGTLAEKLRLSGNTGAWGLLVDNGSARDCVATGNGTGFVLGNGATIKDCAASGNAIGFSASDRSMLAGCISTVNTGNGFNCTSYVALLDCTSSRNGGNGIVVGGNCTVSRCTATRNIPLGNAVGGSGIIAGSGCTIADCTAGNNAFDGIRIDPGVGSTIRNCTLQANPGVGIAVNGGCHVTGNTCDGNYLGINASGNGNRIDGNSCTANTWTGFSTDTTAVHNLFIRNSARGNAFANFSISGSFAGDNPAGPIVNMTGGGTISSTNPWANFSY